MLYSIENNIKITPCNMRENEGCLINDTNYEYIRKNVSTFVDYTIIYITI